jgi:hypothetical protein
MHWKRLRCYFRKVNRVRDMRHRRKRVVLIALTNTLLSVFIFRVGVNTCDLHVLCSSASPHSPHLNAIVLYRIRSPYFYAGKHH